MALSMDVGLVLDGDPAPLSQKGDRAPLFSAHFCCRQTAGEIKMALGMEVGLGPGDFVSDGDPLPSPKRGQSLQVLRPCLLWPNGWMVKMVLGMEVGFGPATLCYMGTQLPSPKTGADPLNFRPIFTVAKRPDASRWHLVWR